jgi:hypothetical protein
MTGLLNVVRDTRGTVINTPKFRIRLHSPTPEMPMNKSRLEAFSDGVIAILITIMVLELRPPDATTWQALRPIVPVFLA